MILWPLRFGWIFVLGLYKEIYLQFFLDVCPFDYTAFVVSGKVGIPEPGSTTLFWWLSLLQMTVLSRPTIVV